MCLSRAALVLVLFASVFSTDNIKDYNPSFLFWENEDLVTTQYGIVQGFPAKTLGKNRTYHIFHGMPYAVPPIGDLRFAPPKEPNNWPGIWDATYERDICPQSVYFAQEVKGSEDCLYLNVYTTQLPLSASAELLPVMVWLHGGKFLSSWGTESAGPDYLLEEDVVVVSLNYRLGIFGFLSTEDLVLPGNNGLKDQILALRWVHKNIAAFGGDPGKVTIFGQSAGAASVSYLVQAPRTKGLFQGAIMQSGCSLSSWALVRRARGFAFHFASKLGIDTDNSSILVANLRTKTVEEIQQAVTFDDIMEFLHFSPLEGLVLGLVIEPQHDGAVITDSSYEILKDGSFNRIPLLVGYNSEEGNVGNPFFIVMLMGLLKLSRTPSNLVPVDINIAKESLIEEAGELIKANYIGTRSKFTKADLVHFTSDALFLRPMREYVRLMSKYADTYFYHLKYQGQISSHTKGRGNDVGHGEELYYLFDTKEETNDFTVDDVKTRTRMVRMWTNFAKYGNPTPVEDLLLQNISWDVASTSPNLTFLQIDGDLMLNSDPDSAHMHFWNWLYENYGNPPYNTY